MLVVGVGRPRRAECLWAGDAHPPSLMGKAPSDPCVSGGQGGAWSRIAGWIAAEAQPDMTPAPQPDQMVGLDHLSMPTAMMLPPARVAARDT